MPEVYDVASGRRYDLAAAAFVDASREVAVGCLATDASTGVVVSFTVQVQQRPIVVTLPAPAGSG